MRNINRTTAFAAACLLAGCASTTIESTGSPLQQPLCRAGSAPSSVSVLWSPKWRPDQKEPPLREAAALRGIEHYFKAQPCISALAIHRVALPEQHDKLSEPRILEMAGAQGGEPDTVVLLVVRELGPRLRIGTPAGIEGGTEVVLETRVTDRRSARSLAHATTHWQKGGAFYIKGVKTLDEDMRAALQAALSPPAGH